MDETDSPQTPPELLVILAALADEKIPAQTIAPKFTGRFNKGVDYVGDLAQFEQEFHDDLAVIALRDRELRPAGESKLSVHSGSDKFSLYPIIRRALAEFGAGVHLKTAGTTWLEEVIGLAEAGGDGLALAKEIYADALAHVDELCAPYATVIDIDRAKLPSAEAVAEWTGAQMANAIRHIQTHPISTRASASSCTSPSSSRPRRARVTRPAESERGDRGEERHGESLRSAPEAAVRGMNFDFTMQTRTLGKTGLELPILSFGASSLGAEFRSVKLEEALASVRVALECGLNFIDTSPFYGRGMSEVLLGIALKGVPRESYTLCTKLGRYDLAHFDFSAKRVAESVDVSLHRLGTDHLDIVLCHDIEFVPMQQIVDETLPALRKQQQAGKVRFIGISGYPMKAFRFVLEPDRRGLRAQLQSIHAAKHALRRRAGAGAESARHRRDERRAFLRAPAHECAAARVAERARGSEGRRAPRRGAVREQGRRHRATRAAVFLRESGHRHHRRRLAQIPTTSANGPSGWPQPIDEELLREVQAIFAPVKNLGHLEGLPENN